MTTLGMRWKREAWGRAVLAAHADCSAGPVGRWGGRRRKGLAQIGWRLAAGRTEVGQGLGFGCGDPVRRDEGGGDGGEGEER